MVMVGKCTSNLYDVIPAETQTPIVPVLNIPVPNIPVRMYLPEDIPVACPSFDSNFVMPRS
jgi:hypothetical protein